MAKYVVDDTSLTAVADAIRAKTGGADALVFPNGMVEAISGISAENVTYPLADKPETMGQMACLARAAQMRDIRYTLKADMDFTGVTTNPVPSGATITGLPYSSVRQTDRFVGFNVSLYTFMTAINNPRSVLYTTSEGENEAENGGIAAVYYGTNCSTFVSYAHDWDYHDATNIIALRDFLEEIDPADMRLCDIVDSSSTNGGSAGHVVLITGIERDENGAIVNVEISESWPAYIRSVTMTYDAFIADYIEAQGYVVYRNTLLHECGYKPSPFVQVFDDEIASDIVYSNLCTNRGDKVSIAEGEEITLNVLLDSGYETIKLLRNGELYGEYTVSGGTIINGDVTLSDLPSGLYTASLYDANGTALENASTFFEVCSVTVTQEGKTFTFAGDGIPSRIVYKNSSGYTLAVIDLTEDDIAKGYKEVGNIGMIPSQVCVPFKTTYGFVVARCEYDETAVDDVELPSEYQEVAYITSSGAQYIDTGVLPSDYPDGIAYEWIGSIADASNTTSRYLFGCLYDGKRSGNLCYYSVSPTQLLDFYAGATSWGLRGGFGQSNTALDERDEITFNCFATSTDNSNAALSYDGSAISYANGTFSACDMPGASVHLMACNGIAGDTRRHQGNTVSFKMSDANGNAIRNFVPCYRKSDNVIGLYDAVEGVFYTNAGTGAFTKGADV